MKNNRRFNMGMDVESTYWLSNKEWYKIDRKNDQFVILDSAPTRAKLSFEIWSGKRKSAKKGFFSRLM